MTRLIDADALIPMVKYATTDSEIGVFPIKIGFNAIIEVINNAPTIDAVPVKHGKWEEQGVFINKQIDEWQEARCSVCRLFHTTPYKYTFIKYAYCPYCGARMDKE